MWRPSVLDSLKITSSPTEAGRARRESRRRSSVATRLSLESLEDRCLLSFSPAVNSAVHSSPQAVVTGDFNGDGKVDLVVATASQAVNVLLGNANGTFQPAQISSTIGWGRPSLAVGDFNTDGKLDVVTVNDNNLSVLVGNGNGTFQTPTSIALPLNQNPQSVVVGDINSDGKLDLAVTGQASFGFGYWANYTYYYTSGTSAYVNVLLGNGSGAFANTNTYPVNGGSAPSIAIGDFNGDLKPDLITAGDFALAHVLLGSGNGAFGAATDLVPGSSSVSVATGDFNSDGKTDLVGVNAVGVNVLLGNGNGTFGTAATFTTGASNSALAVSDFNRDGKPDLGVANASGVSVLLSNGNGTFGTALPYVTGTAPSSVVVGDFNVDTFPDLAVANSGSTNVSVLLNAKDWSGIGAPANIVVSGFPSNVTAGVPGTITVTVKDGSGHTVAGYRGTIHFTSNDPQAVLPGDYTFTAADAGVHVSSAALKTTGLWSFTATDNASAGITGLETGINVSPAAASHFVVSGPAISQAASAFSSLTVTALDAYNNLAPSYLGTIHFSSTDPGAVLPANYTFAQWDLGKHSFAATLKSVSSQTVAATDTVTGSITGGTSVMVKPQFVVAGFPSPTTAGVAGSFTVTAKDGFGSTVTAFTGTVRITSYDYQAVLPPIYTFTTSDHGVHTFIATLKSAGSMLLWAADPSLYGPIAANSQAITVNPAAANHLELDINGLPAFYLAGTSLSTSRVLAMDPYNNVDPGYLGTVTFSSSDPKAVLPANYTFTAADHGAHNFTVTLKTAGTQSIAVRDTTTVSMTGVNLGIVVNPAAASTLLVTGYPSPITAGVTGNFKVTLKDSYGNVATGYIGTVSFSSSDSRAAKPGNYTFTVADAGMHTFGATLKTAGNQSITAKDTVTGSLTGTDGGITVKPAAATKIVVSAPASIRSGVAFSLTITVKDAFNNVVTGYTGTIHFKSRDRSAALPADYTFKSADKGVHPFTGLVLRKKGNQKITITDTLHTSITGSLIENVL